MSFAKHVYFCLCFVSVLGVFAGSAVAGTAYSAAVLADNPLLYWGFDDPANPELVGGLEQDALAPTGDDMYATHEALGSGLYLGSAGLGTVDHSFYADDLSPTDPLSAADGYTVEFWAMQVDYTSNQYLLRFGYEQPAFLRGFGTSTDGKIAVYGHLPSGTMVTGEDVLVADVGHHYVFVANGGQLDQYIDGVGPTTISTEWASDLALTGYMTATAARFADGSYGIRMHGAIDEIAVYDRALSAETIQAHYDAASVPEPSALALLCFGLIGLYVCFGKERR